MATGAIYGSVRDSVTKDSIPNATNATLICNFGIGTATGHPYPDGAYILDCPPGSGYVLNCTAPGYRDWIKTVNVDANTFTNVEIELTPIPYTPPPQPPGGGHPHAVIGEITMTKAPAQSLSQATTQQVNSNTPNVSNDSGASLKNTPIVKNPNVSNQSIASMKYTPTLTPFLNRNPTRVGTNDCRYTYSCIINGIRCVQSYNETSDQVIIKVYFDNKIEFFPQRILRTNEYMYPSQKDYYFQNIFRVKIYVRNNNTDIFIGEAVINATPNLNGYARITKDRAIYDLNFIVKRTPTVKTLQPHAVTDTQAVLNGQLTDLGGQSYCTIYFGYSTDTQYCNFSTKPKLGPSVGQNFSENFTNLKENTTYYFRAIVYGEDGSHSEGSILTFKTSGGTTSNASSTTTSPTKPLVRQAVRPSYTPPIRQVRQMPGATSNMPSPSRTQSAPINRSTLVKTNAQAPRPGSTAPPRIVTRSSPGGTSSKTQPAPIPRTRTSPTRNIPSTSRIQPAPINRSTLVKTNAQAPRPGSTAPPRIMTRSSPGGTPLKAQPASIPRTITSSSKSPKITMPPWPGSTARPTSNIPTTSRIQPTPVVKQAPPQTTVQTPVQSIKKPFVRKK